MESFYLGYDAEVFLEGKTLERLAPSINNRRVSQGHAVLKFASRAARVRGQYRDYAIFKGEEKRPLKISFEDDWLQ